MNLVLLAILLVFGFISQQVRGSDSAEAIQIIKLNNHTFELDSERVEEIFGRADIKDRHVVVVSIAGAAREGKSFFLNFCLRYLNSKYVRHDPAGTDWIGDGELSGFKWIGGNDHETTGMWIWSEIFTHDFDDEKVAIILLDTQGLYDRVSNDKDCIGTFTISMMLSSVQIFNVMHRVQSDTLGHLRDFTEYGLLAKQQSNENPFQSLLFLVRDWSSPTSYSYGYSPEYVDYFLTPNATDTKQMRQLRERIKSSFQTINAFLMPHPGKFVAVSSVGQSNLTMAQIDEEFKQYVKKLVPSIFAPENLTIKSVNGQKLQAKDLTSYLEKYVEIFNGDELPEPQDTFTIMAELNHTSLVKKCVKNYVNLMHSSLAKCKIWCSQSVLSNSHETAKNEALEQFNKTPKFGAGIFASKFKLILVADINEEFTLFNQTNEKNWEEMKKNAARTKTGSPLLMGICLVFGGMSLRFLLW